MAISNPFKFGTDLWDPSNKFETSWILHPWLLFACRAIISIYILFTRFFVIGYTCATEPTGCQSARRSFSYFTILTYWGLGFYFFFAAVHTLTYALRGRPLLDRFPRPLQALHSLYYTTVVTYPFLVTIVYWVILYSGSDKYGSTFALWADVSQHGINSAFALFELVIPRTAPPPLVHVLWAIVILALYLALAFITLAAQGWYVYSFLDHDHVGGRGIVAAYCFGILAAIVIIFFLAWGLIWVRRWITESKLGMDGKFAKQPTWRNSDVEGAAKEAKEMGGASATGYSNNTGAF